MTKRDVIKSKKSIRKNAKAHLKNGTTSPAVEHEYAIKKAQIKELKLKNKNIKKAEKEAKKSK